MVVPVWEDSRKQRTKRSLHEKGGIFFQMSVYRVDYEIDDSDSGESTGPPPYSPLACRPGYQEHLSSSLGSSSSSIPIVILERPTLPPITLRNGKRLLDQEGTPGEAGTQTVKKLKPSDCPLRKRIEWLKSNACHPPALTLREKSARAVADSWSDRAEVREQLEEMGRSKTASAFKAEIGVHLKGENLVAFIRREGGLDAIAHRTWPEVFQRLLTAVYAETGRFKQSIQARKELSRSIKAFRSKALNRVTLQPAVHRLGLTDMYSQPHLLGLDKQIFSFYKKVAHREHHMIKYPLLRYPLPPVLRNRDRAKVALFDRCYPANPDVAKREAEWRRKVSSEVREKEEWGLELSEETDKLFRSSLHDFMFWNDTENKPLSERHLELTCLLIKLDSHCAFQLVVTAAFLLLTDPYYSSDRLRLEEPKLAPRFREFRVDVFRVLARSLGWLHASLDLPLAVLQYAKQFVHASQPPCLSELAQLALIQLEIHVRYGHYSRAGDIFWSWNGRLPSSSWLSEEMILIYCAGVFCSVQEQLTEALLTERVHDYCFYRPCWDNYVKPTVRSAGNKIFRLRCLLHRCLADATVTDVFRRNLECAVLICSFFNLSVLKISSKHRQDFSHELRILHQRIKWSRCGSLHLKPFLHALPVNVREARDWHSLVGTTIEDEKPMLESFARTGDANRNYADLLFSLVFCAVFHQSPRFTFKHLISDCLDVYKKSTVGRHHRIPLLEKLLSFHENNPTIKPHVYLNSEEQAFAKARAEASGGKYPDLHHPLLKKADICFSDLTSNAIREFALQTMRDCLEDFEYQDFSSAEQFCRYLRERDDAAPAWIEFGLKCFRFDHARLSEH